ncbi:MAG: hypothetical protein KKH79_10285, partial [Candidatus Thermoplasmatota archaeon]|nr:hypothetical protein [Candidatus Thermoplasmatota archaeon]
HETRPVMYAFFQFIGPLYLKFKFQNVGKGVAKDIRAKVYFDGKEEISWYWPSLNSDDREIVYIPKPYDNWKGMLKVKEIRIVFTYQDLTGKELGKEISILPKNFDLEKSQHAVETPYMKEIVKKLEEIEKNIHHISSGFNRISVITYTPEDIENEHKEHLERVGAIEADELKKD